MRLVELVKSFQRNLVRVDPHFLALNNRVYLIRDDEIVAGDITHFYIGEVNDWDTRYVISHYGDTHIFNLVPHELGVFMDGDTYSYSVYGMVVTDDIVMDNEPPNTIFTAAGVDGGEPQFHVSFHRVFPEEVSEGDYYMPGDDGGYRVMTINERFIQGKRRLEVICNRLRPLLLPDDVNIARIMQVGG